MGSETSAGGVVIFGNAVMLLKKFNGDWVLPKGRVEAGESYAQAALREVYEESGIKAEIIQYVGDIHYKFRKIIRFKTEIIGKRVYWYLMKSKSLKGVPQKEEGFIDVKFFHRDEVTSKAKYEDEKRIIEKALLIYDKRSGK